MGSMPTRPVTALEVAASVMDTPADMAQRAVLPRPRRRSRRIVLAAIVIALGLAGLWYWWAFLSPVTVSIAPVQTNVAEQVFGLGTVGARVRSNVGFKVGGVLVALAADQGDVVRAGQQLARLDARDIEAQVAMMKAGVALARANIEKAKADVTAALANLANAKAVSARRTNLAAKGFASAEEAQSNEAAVAVAAANLAEAQSGVAVAEAATQSAEAEEAFQQATLANYSLYAPYDAQVISRNIELGSAANPGQSVLTMVAANSIWVESYVDERLAGRLSVGQLAEIILRSDPKKRIPGRIERIEIQSDSVNEERLVDVAFDKIPENIHLAEQAEVVITTGTLPSAVLVMPTAISDLKEEHGTVWTVENGRLARRTVTVGRSLLDGRLPILDGVPSDALVVAAAVSGLHVGRAARIAEVSPK